ncbi:MAG TPA: hypothetical protein VFN18_01580 [Solirubrobacterales bacterium]|nr:hypothetical protein [Solirubrobacterales bacterium]
MTDHRQVPEPGETIYLPRPSWAPIFFAIGALGLICGTYAAGFIFAPKIWGLLGLIFALAAFRSIVRGSVRDYYRLPRRQETRGAALPVETISAPPTG